ncbi:MAG: DUF2127 domain-containing protein [Chromatiales bacterium]
MSTSRGVYIVAWLEAAKGGLVLLVGFGLLAVVHQDIQAMAEQLVRRFHLNPANHYPQIFIHALSAATEARLWFLACTALAYAIIRFIEAYGLWHEKRWAEWFAAASGGIYIPIEVYELWQGVTWAKTCMLVLNTVIVAYMSHVLWQPRRRGGALSKVDRDGFKIHRPR